MNTFKTLTAITIAILCFALTAHSQNKPKATYLVGKAKVTLWENERQGKHGKFTAKTFKVEKIYKKGDEWKTTDLFNLTELLQLRAAIDKAVSDEGVKVGEGDK